MSLSIALQNAISGLQLNQRALDVTSQNVANVNTDGYSRKIVNQKAIIIEGQGSGVAISSIQRQVNEYMLKDLRTQISDLNKTTEINNSYGRMQDLFGAPGSDTSVAFALADLASRFQALSVTPESSSITTEIVSQAILLAQQFNSIAEDIQNLRLEADINISDAVTRINADLSQIQELNIRIAENTALNLGVSELQDQRDVLINDLSEMIDINYFERPNGEYVIFTDAGLTLLDRTAQTLSHSAATSLDPGITWADGSISAISLGAVDITSSIRSGSIAGWVSLRDTTLPNLYSQFEELAQTLATEVNKIHNDGVAYPGIAIMTGSREVAAGDTPNWTGNFRVGIVDTAGVVVEVQDFDLSTYATTGALVTAINGMTNASASIDANGNLVVDAAGTNRVALNELTSVVTVGNQTMGASAYFGMNDFFSQPNNFDVYTSAQQPSTATAAATGTLTFSGVFGSTTVAVTAGDSLATVAASINGNATLTTANISAAVITDGTGVRLRINDTDGNNFYIADSSNFVSTMELDARQHNVAASIAVRAEIVANPSLISRAELSDSSTLAATDQGVTIGGQAVAERIANLFNAPLSFQAVGQLPAGSKTLAGYATGILSLNATQAQAATENQATKKFLHDTLQDKTRSISAVNLDEEMANMIMLENSYAASARVITTASEMFDTLLAMTR